MFQTWLDEYSAEKKSKKGPTIQKTGEATLKEPKLASPISASKYQEQLIECQIETRKFYPKTNQGAIQNMRASVARSSTGLDMSPKNGRNSSTSQLK